MDDETAFWGKVAAAVMSSIAALWFFFRQVGKWPSFEKAMAEHRVLLQQLNDQTHGIASNVTGLSKDVAEVKTGLVELGGRFGALKAEFRAEIDGVKGRISLVEGR